ncbi:MAG: PilZ domain-containing protein [Cohaesibacter sp.]|jgi:hypothetical protein|nr:PilZ domain-containing protein [Cohaesibacter sp.]
MSVDGLIKKDTKVLHNRIMQDQQENKHLRRHQRRECFIIAIMNVLERSVPMEGVIKEISAGGVLFRPASTYLLNRKGERISIVMGEHKISGKIVAVRPTGYGVKFLDTLEDEEVEKLIEMHSIDRQ